jgi:hypothetical protein
VNFDRKGKKTSNKDWQSTTDEEARIAKLNSLLKNSPVRA